MKKAYLILAVLLSSGMAFGQDSKVEISGSADVYYKYDFAKRENIQTSFGTDQNSLSIGMLDVVAKKTTGKTSFVGELSFGPRGQFQSIPNGDGREGDEGNTFNVQNLYVSYNVNDDLKLTAGYMSTFEGYEMISPAANFHYSTSYLFTNGPFQNAGLKANYAVSDKVDVMLGVFTDTWNTYKTDPNNGLSTIGGQVAFRPAENISTYFDFLTGDESGTLFDFTGNFQVTDAFKLAVNAATFKHGDASTRDFSGVALYPSYAITDNFALGLRGEYFTYQDKGSESQEITAFTLSGNLKSGDLMFIPEIRLDSGKNEIFLDVDGAPTKSASQVLMACVYTF
ncbi:MAG: porin [Flavobacteriaceae bacterium]|nr:MAG: porin [Flavobacteriaceae bacterium]